MARQSKDYKNLNLKVERIIFERLEEFIKETRLSKTATVEKALIEYIDKYKQTGKI